jgi:F-type H+-transporting ATPase subunit b
MDATSWATLIALFALIIFIGVVVYVKGPAMVAKSLDERAARIRNELDDARKLREEAHALLLEYQKKRKDAEAEAGGIVAAAKREAELIVEDAKAKTEDYVARRAATAEAKIAQAERDAVNEVRAHAVDIAIEAARSVMAGEIDGKVDAGLFKSSLQELKSKMN